MMCRHRCAAPQPFQNKSPISKTPVRASWLSRRRGKSQVSGFEAVTKKACLACLACLASWKRGCKGFGASDSLFHLMPESLCVFVLD